MRAPRHPPGPAWLRDAVFYQVYPQSFFDTNGDGIGDLPGIVARLDYLRELGVTALWLNPIFASPFGDAGYDVSDFRRIAPRYGTMADARRLFREAHRRGMRVVLDLVAGHTSDAHPWFRAAARGDARMRRRYIWTSLPAGTPVPETTLARETVAAPHGGAGSYIPNFFPFQPALNFGYADPHPDRPWERPPEHPDCLALRLELRDIMRFWLDAGCDGFRVDMASSLIKRDLRGTALERLWRGFRSWFDAEHPDAVLLSEWSQPDLAIRSGFHVDFLLHFNEPAYTELIGPFRTVRGDRCEPPVFFQRGAGGDITRFLRSYQRQWRRTRREGYIALPTGNHDLARPSYGRDERDLRVLYTMLFTLPGVPFIYYGDEIGMRPVEGLPEKEGSMWRTGSRTPMQWAPGRNLGFSAAPPDRLYLPVDSRPDAPTVAAQQADPDSLLHFVRRLLALRREHEPLGNTADFSPLVARRGQPFVYERRAGVECIVVAINPSSRPATVALPVPRGVNTAEPLLAWHASGRVEGRRLRLELAGVACVVLRLGGRRSPGPVPFA